MCEAELQFENETKKICKSCASLRKKVDEKKTTYFCNIIGMAALEELLPKKCDRFREKKVESR